MHFVQKIIARPSFFVLFVFFRNYFGDRMDFLHEVRFFAGIGPSHFPAEKTRPLGRGLLPFSPNLKSLYTINVAILHYLRFCSTINVAILHYSRFCIAINVARLHYSRFCRTIFVTRLYYLHFCSTVNVARLCYLRFCNTFLLFITNCHGLLMKFFANCVFY